MSPRNSATPANGAGAFATARRGGLTFEQAQEIGAHRNRDRPTPWQALAVRYGVSVIDVRRAAGDLVEVREATITPPAKPEPANDAEVEMKRGRWSEDDHALMLKLYLLDRLPVIDIARRLGRTSYAVTQRIHALGLSRKKARFEPRTWEAA